MRTRRIRPHERRPLPNGMLVDRIASSWKLILLTALFAAGMAFWSGIREIQRQPRMARAALAAFAGIQHNS